MYTLYTIAGMECPYCEKAEKLFQMFDMEYELIEVKKEDGDPYWELFKRNRWSTVPQIVKNDKKHIGGYQDLERHVSNGYYKSVSIL